jgi:hypothetical protein
MFVIMLYDIPFILSESTYLKLVNMSSLCSCKLHHRDRFFCVQAGALMIVGVLATRATLAPKLVQDLILFVARSAQHDALESIDLPWLRVTVMAIISLVQVWS